MQPTLLWKTLQIPLRKIQSTEEPKEIDQLSKEVINLEIILYPIYKHEIMGSLENKTTIYKGF